MDSNNFNYISTRRNHVFAPLPSLIPCLLVPLLFLLLLLSLLHSLLPLLSHILYILYPIPPLLLGTHELLLQPQDPPPPQPAEAGPLPPHLW